jgi:hypothetical protein
VAEARSVSKAIRLLLGRRIHLEARLEPGASLPSQGQALADERRQRFFEFEVAG